MRTRATVDSSHATRLRRIGLALAAALLLAPSCGGGGSSGWKATSEAPSTSPFPTGAFEVVADAPRGSAFSAASDGDGYLVVWTAFLGRGGSDVVAMRLSSRGEPLDVEPLRLSDAGAAAYLEGATAAYEGPGASFDGERYSVGLYGSGRIAENTQAPGQEVAFVTVSPDGRVDGPPTVLATQFSFSTGFTALRPPVVTAGTEQGLVAAYPFFHAGGAEGFGTNGLSFVSASGAVLAIDVESDLIGPRPVLTSQSEPSITAGSGAVLAPRIEARFFLGRGNEPAPEPEVDVRAQWLVGNSSEDIVLATASPAVLGSLRLGPPEFRTAVAAGPDDFLVLWTLQGEGEPRAPKVIHSARTRWTNGAPESDPPLIVAEGESAKNLGGVAYAEERFLVVWAEGEAALGVTVGRAGSVSAPFEIDPGPVLGAPVVTTDGAHFLVLIARPKTVDSVSIDGVFVD